ncbi:hypothetical protein LEMLEM_LOCUS2038 [Lemmus lemmus]
MKQRCQLLEASETFSSLLLSHLFPVLVTLTKLCQVKTNDL